MSVQVFRSKDQADGSFNGGAILEKKPIGFPQDGGILRPYSNLFYWAHAWSEKGSTIGEHPHQGFEILSFVLSGKMEHYDSQLKDWITLHAGDAQIIRSGSGIRHAEHVHENSSFFQIWFDPDLSKTLSLPATYDDYPASRFSSVEENGYTRILYTRDRQPIELTAEGVTIYRLDVTEENLKLSMLPDKICSVFILSGNPVFAGQPAGKGDFVVLKERQVINISGTQGTGLFVIETPLHVPYRTYADRANY